MGSGQQAAASLVGCSLAFALHSHAFFYLIKLGNTKASVVLQHRLYLTAITDLRRLAFIVVGAHFVSQCSIAYDCITDV